MFTNYKLNWQSQIYKNFVNGTFMSSSLKNSQGKKSSLPAESKQRLGNRGIIVRGLAISRESTLNGTNNIDTFLNGLNNWQLWVRKKGNSN